MKSKLLKDVSTPSVKDWLNKDRSDEEDNAKQYEEEEDDWSNVERENIEDQWYDRKQPQEEWSESESEPAVVQQETTRMNREQQDHCEYFRIATGEDGNPVVHEKDVNFDELDETEMKVMLREMYGIIIKLQKQGQIKNNDRVKDTATITENQQRLNLITKAVIKNDNAIEANSRKINQMELRSMKANIIVTGIKEKRGENCKQVIKAFFKEKLKIEQEILIEVVHRIGDKEKEERSMVIRLKDVQQKAVIFKNTKHLKGTTNEDGDPFFVKDQLPQQQEEDVHKKRMKIKINRELIDAQQQEIN